MAKNIPISVRNRLLKLIRETGQDAMLVWTRYAIERFLYRLSVSPHAGVFMLKGAMLFLARTGKIHRPTRDLDLLGFGDGSEAHVADVIRSVCEIECQADGIRFDTATILVTRIREDQEYEGCRVTLTAHLDTVKIENLQIDIGFGDAVTPAPVIVEYPPLLDFPGPRISGYPWETVIAEKVQAMVALGLATSRLKDFDDIRTLSRLFAFDGATLSAAIRATFERRKTELPTTAPVALTEEFAKDVDKLKQWTAYMRRNNVTEDGDSKLEKVIADLSEFVLPPLFAASGKFPMNWDVGGPWKPMM